MYADWLDLLAMLLWFVPLPFASSFQQLLAACMANMRMTAAVGSLVLTTSPVLVADVDGRRMTWSKGAASIGRGSTVFAANATFVANDGPVI